MFEHYLKHLQKRQQHCLVCDTPTMYQRIFRGGMPALVTGQYTNANLFYSSYIDTYMERDRLLKEASFRWIRENPLQYVAQIPVKLFALYCEDTWTERVKPDMGFRVVLSEVRGDKWEMAELAAILALKSVVYYFILFFFCYYIWTMRGDWFNRRNVYLLLPLLGTAATVLFVITSRYHYPYLFAITIYAAAGWDVFMRKRQEMSRRVHRQ